jgi:hypothetical protein
MYVTSTENSTVIQSTKKKDAKKNAHGFSELISAGEIEEMGTSSTSAINNTSPLLFLQEVNDEEYNKKTAVKQGFDTIQYLDNIRNGLLLGSLSKDTILQLDAILKNFSKNFTDPNLTQILEEIELRAKVEIAKWERN